jgi:hypothetical protein
MWLNSLNLSCCFGVGERASRRAGHHAGRYGKAKLRSFGGGRLSAYRLLKSNRQGQPLAQVQLESVAFVALYCEIEERWIRSECGQEPG